MSYRSLNKNVNTLANAVTQDVNHLATEHAKVVGAINTIVQALEKRQVVFTRVVVIQGMIDVALLVMLVFSLLR